VAGDTVSPVKKIVYVDMDNTLVDFMSAKPRVPAELWDEYERQERLDDLPGIFALMDPVPHAVES